MSRRKNETKQLRETLGAVNDIRDVSLELLKRARAALQVVHTGFGSCGECTADTDCPLMAELNDLG